MPDIIIALDAMGGDNAPDAIARGAILALEKYGDIKILLSGPQAKLEPLLEGVSGDIASRIEILDAQDAIDAHEPPMLAVRRKSEASMVKAMLAVKEGRAQAMVSAGPTGAVLAGGILRIGRIHGIERPALAPLIPGRSRPFLLIDSGANVDCQPSHLEQFGLMGSIYMQKVIGIDNPNVCLVNIGEEPEKGDQLTKEAYQRMLAQTAYTFSGNIEARELPVGRADVVVCDGFVGNALLKYTEGLASALMGMLKDSMMASARAKVGALLLKPAFKLFKDKMNYEEHGGAPLLGIQGALVKAHGSSNATAIMNAVRQARAMVQGNVVNLIERGLEQLAT